VRGAGRNPRSYRDSSKNLHSRHLTETIIAARITTMRQGARTEFDGQTLLIQIKSSWTKFGRM
jgi:hypothetical protein